MASFLVVVPPPALDAIPRVGQRQEPGRVQAFRPQPTVECFYVSVIRGFSGPRKRNFHAVQIRPLVQHPPCKLGAVVHLQRLRLAAISASRSSSSTTWNARKLGLGAIASASRV